MVQAISRDEFEDIKALLGSAARYAEIANQQSAENARQIADSAKLVADNAHAITRLESKLEELAEAQKATETKLAQLTEAQKATETKLTELAEAQKTTDQRLESFITESQRLLTGQADRLNRLDAMIERYDGVLAYLMRKEGN